MRLRRTAFLLPAAALLLGATAVTGVPGWLREEGVLARLKEVGLDGDAKKVAKAIRAMPRAAIDSPRAPALLQAARKQGGPLPNFLLEQLAFPKDGSLDYVTVRDAALKVVGAKVLRPPQLPVETDLRAFESVLEDVFQEIRRNIGTGQELDLMVSRAQGAIDRMRLATEAKAMDPQALEVLQEQFERLSKAVPSKMLPQAMRLVELAMQFQKPERVQVLRRLEGRQARDSDVVGDVLEDRDTPFGRFVIGGFGDNVYDCTQIDVIFDPGGNDTYNGPAGATMPLRRLGMVVDVSGDDIYAGGNDSLGSAIYGIGLLADLEGDDKYTADARSGGFGMGGVGVLLDVGGRDEVRLDYLGAGCGLGGVGMFLDLAGDDLQVLNSQGFGLGMPVGFGLFADLQGNDERQVKGVEISDSRGSGAAAMACGMGTGLIGLLHPGVGIYLDGDGEDNVQTEMLSFGCGAQGGLGIAIDMGEANDIYRVGAGSLGAAHNSGIGLFVEIGGDDDYTATGGLTLGASAHNGEAWAVDFAGDDRYRAMGPSFGWSIGQGLAGFFDFAGTDRYRRDDAKLPWPARGPVAKGSSVSVSWDEGGMKDDYRWDGDSSPVDGRTIQGEVAADGGKAKTARVDR